MPVIFICYRRSDSQDVTGRIYDRLVSKFTPTQVFKDVDNIPLGVSFPMHIQQMLGKADLALVIVGPGWLSATDEYGRRRLDDPGDYVRVEIESALRAGIPVIPVLVSNARMPQANELPKPLQGLVTRNGMPVRPDPDFNTDIGRLFSGIEHLERLLKPKLASPPRRPRQAQKLLDVPVSEPASEPRPRLWRILGGMALLFAVLALVGVVVSPQLREALWGKNHREVVSASPGKDAAAEKDGKAIAQNAKEPAPLQPNKGDNSISQKAKEAAPVQPVVKPMPSPTDDDNASGAFINSILAELKQIPPMKSSLKESLATLKAETMPPFPKDVLVRYSADYASWSELEAKLKDDTYKAKHPLRAAVLEAKKALDRAETLTIRELLVGPLTPTAKASFFKEQTEIAAAIVDLEEAQNKMVEADKAENRAAETNQRWPAHFDFTMARLKSRLVYLHEYNFSLASIRADRLPVLENGESGWRLSGRMKLSNNDSKVKNLVKDIGQLWKTLAEEHPNTPWALFAQRESLYEMGLEWRASRD